MRHTLSGPATATLTLAVMLGAACDPGPAAQGTGARPSAASAPANAPSGTASNETRPAEIEKIKVGMAADSAMYTPFFIAKEKGYYTDEGLEIEMITLPGGPGTTALIAGEIDYGTSAGSAAGAMLKGAPIKVIYTNADRPGYDIWSTGPEITSLADLPGKTLGIQSRGDTTDIGARMVLQQHGIDPNTVSYITVGGGTQRV